MPIVRINMFEGRSLEKKRRLVREMTKLVSDVCEVDESGVHVLIEEMSRDDWGRGGVLHRDRGPKTNQPSSFARTSFRSVSWIRVAEGKAEEYLAYRRDDVNPAMASMSGFLGTMILRDRGDERAFLLLNSWEDEAAWRAYQSTGKHDELKAKIRGQLVETMTIGRYATTDLPSSSGLDDPNAPHRYFTVSTHRVKPDVTEVYLNLRATAVHPAMAGFEGFVSSNALEALDEPYACLIVNSWTSSEAASAYSTSASHYALRDQVRALLSEHSGTRQYELVSL